MDLKLHPNAVTSFNAKAEALVSTVSLSAGSDASRQSHAPSTDVFIKATIGPEDIREWGHFTKIDDTGLEVTRCAHTPLGMVCLSGNAHREFLLLVEQMQRTRPLREAVSEATVRDLIFQWLSDRYTGATTVAMVDAVLTKCSSELVECKVLVPVYRLRVERDFTLGNVSIRTLRRSEIDQWRTRGLQAAPNQADRINAAVDRLAAKCQGNAVAEYSVMAEPRRAFERAREETEDALAILRFVSHAAVSLTHRSYCVARGRQHEERDEYIVIRDNEWYPTESIVDPANLGWHITAAALDLAMSQGGLAHANALLREKNRSDYQDRLLDSLLLYSRSTLQGDVTARLIYMLSALESFLLQTYNESVGETLAIRMAFIVGTTVDERQSIVDTVRQTYRARSGFVHHGATIADSARVSAFVPYAWRTLRHLLAWHGQYQKPEDLIAVLDRRKLA
jgi:hypothetical protein